MDKTKLPYGRLTFDGNFCDKAWSSGLNCQIISLRLLLPLKIDAILDREILTEDEK